AVLLKAGHEVEIYSQDMHHYTEEHLTEYLNNNKFDVIGMGITAGYWQYRKMQKISDAINRSDNRPFYIMGGHGPTPEPEFYIRKTGANAIVMGEGEITIVELLTALEEKKPLSSVKGIAYSEKGEVKVNERNPLIKDIDTMPMPAYELFPMEYYRLMRKPHATNEDFVMSVISGRGCLFKCNFCYRMDEGFRPRSSESIVDEVMMLKEKYGITYIDFYDELLMSSPERTIKLCETFIKRKMNMKWCCSGRLNHAKPEVLKIMKRAGCVFINYGIESMDNVVLKNMRKGLTDNIIIKGIEATLELGISPGLNMMFGNFGDNKDTLNKAVDFLIKYDDGAQVRTIRPVTPYPGTPLYEYALEKGMIKDCEDFYENKHTNSDLLSVNFTDMSDDDFYRCLMDANRRLLTNYHNKQMTSMLKQTEDLYVKRDASFRGFRQS
ncbi:MAG: B12-binding domain-containing radical SAM protein, partial [Candidatus Omnitrophica bacterium]|nr:B12-binding domain-containing radical SAM protein [Candidatus Omnitrophota bacterium]